MKVYVIKEVFRDYEINILGVYNVDTTSEDEIKKAIYNYVKDKYYNGEEPNDYYFYEGFYSDRDVAIDYTIESVGDNNGENYKEGSN